MEDDEKHIKELELVVSIGKDYFGYYFKGIFLYFGILGILLKFIVDADPGSPDRLLMYVIGIVINVLALACSFLLDPKYREISQRCDFLVAKLGMENIYFSATVYSVRLLIAVKVVIFGAWLVMYGYLT